MLKDWLFKEKEVDNEGIAIICKSFLLFHCCLILSQVKVVITFALQMKIFVKISQVILLPWSFYQVQPNTLILDEISSFFFVACMVAEVLISPRIIFVNLLGTSIPFGGQDSALL